MSGKDLSPEPRAAVRVVRPGGGNTAGRGTVPQAPPMPMAPPSSLPPWLDPASPSVSDPGPVPGPRGAGAAVWSSDSSASESTRPPGAGTGTRTGAGGPGGSGGGPTGIRTEDAEAELTPEQREIRDLLHRSVGDLAPRPDALEQLRRAVPRRRQRRRRIAGSVAATVVLCSLGTVALHAAGMSVDSADSPQSSQSYGGTASGSPDHAGGSMTASPTLVPIGPGRVLPGVGSSFGSGAGGPGLATAGPGSSGRPDPSLTRPATGASGGLLPTAPGGGSGGSSAPVAECTRAQLGDGADTVGTPDAAGVVYGTFQVSNVSGTGCKVSMPGAVSVLAVSGTDKSYVSVVQHTAGDPAGGLPQPSATPSPVLLAPGGSYLVEFAWVPTTGSGAPSCADPSAPGGTGSPGADAGTTGTDTGISADDATSPSTDDGAPSVTLGHTPGAGGSTAASAVIADACAGTVYRTDPLPPAG